MTPLHRLPLFYFAYSFVPLLIDDTSFSCHTRPLRLWGDPPQSRADWFLWMTIYYKLWSVYYKYLVVAMVLPQLVLRFTLAISLSSFPLIFCLSWAHALIWTSNHWQSLTLAPPVHPLTHVELIRTLQGLDSQEVGWWQQKWRREMRTEREWVVERMGRRTQARLGFKCQMGWFWGCRPTQPYSTCSMFQASQSLAAVWKDLYTLSTL